ncbi:hypothetical protein [Streptomyces acidiscabies]|nr:hypothetical protein [Streptomyces acidiscabies]
MGVPGGVGEGFTRYGDQPVGDVVGDQRVQQAGVPVGAAPPGGRRSWSG